MENNKIFATAMTEEPEAAKGIDILASKIVEELGGASCDLAILFVSEKYADIEARQIASLFREKVSPRVLIGCNSNGVIGDTEEIEMRPALSVMAMHLPRVGITPISLTSQDIQFLPTGEAFMKHIDLYPTDHPKFLCLADPAECPVTELLDLFNDAYPQAPVIGGLASANVMGVDNWLILDDEIQKGGAIAVALTGDIFFDILVSQGCRPIGDPFAITKSEQNILYELSGKPAVDVFREVYSKLSEEDKELAQDSLFVGLAMDEKQTDFKLGDFLIRNIVGIDQENGAIAVGELLQEGRTLQFQLRDAQSSEEDLTYLLQRLAKTGRANKEGAVLVSCCGRGEGLFKEPNHDIAVIQSVRGPLSVTGFFANGEFGPVEKRNYVHGYTSSLTIIK